MKNSALIFVFLIVCLSTKAQTAQDTLTASLNMICKETIVPGFAVAVVSRERIHYKNSFGYANVASKEAYQTSTIQNIASLSKTFIGVAIMKAIEQGLFTLDTPINDILPFKVIHPKFPDTPITVRHLAAHTSGIEDSSIFWKKSYVAVNKDKSARKNLPFLTKIWWNILAKNEQIPLSDFMKKYLIKGNENYSKRNFGKKPGTYHSYTNAGAALAGLVIEVAAKMPFADYTQQHIFEPLQMNDTGWSFDKVDMKKHATLYHPKNQIAIPKYTLNTFPDGGLITNVDDLVSYTQELLRATKGESDLLTAVSTQEMTTSRLPENPKDPETGYGVFWDVAEVASGHGGSDPGTNTLLYFFPEQNVGILFIINMSLDDNKKTRKIYGDIWRALKKYSKSVAEK